MSCERSSARAPVSRPSEVADSGISRRSLSPISSSNARAAASLCADGCAEDFAADCAEDAAVEPVAPGSRLHADMSGSVAVDASVAMAWRRVNKGFDNGGSHR